MKLKPSWEASRVYMTDVTRVLLYLKGAIHWVQSLLRQLFQGTQSSLRKEDNNIWLSERDGEEERQGGRRVSVTLQLLFK